VFNYLAGSLSRIFTTLQETGDKTILYGFVSAFGLNAVLALQMIYYWNSPTSAPHAKEMGETPKKIAMGETSATSGFTSSAEKVRSPTTRRRG
jgi:mannose-P-dolichol utilization defect protein 1